MNHHLKQLLFLLFLAIIATSGIMITLAVSNRGSSPVAWWKFDEGHGLTAYDAAGSNDGTASGGATWKQEDECKSGKCLSFDGSNDYVNVPDDVSLRVESGNFTVSVWVKPNIVQQQVILFKGNPNMGDGYILVMNRFGSDISLTKGGIADQQVSYTFQAGNWYHIVAVQPLAGNITYYINGVSIGSYSNTSAYNSSSGQAFYIGDAGTYFANKFNGLIDDVRVYNYARSAAQIKADYVSAAGGRGAAVVQSSKFKVQNPSEGLVGYWKFDETALNACDTANDACDFSGSGNDLTALGNAAPTSTAKFGYASTYDASADYYCSDPDNDGDCEDDDDLDMGTNDITYECWIKTTHSDANWHLVMGKGGTGSPYTGAYFYINGGKVWGYFNEVAANSLNQGSISVADGVWHHIAYVFDRDGLAVIYVDGVKDPTTTNIASFSGSISNNGEFKIGGYYTYSQDYGGQIDDVKVYKTARSASQIRRDYESGPGPIAYWKMDERTGQYAYDTSGYTNNGTLGTGGTADASDPAWTNGKYGSAPLFDGSDDYISSPNTTSINFTSNFTVSAWVQSTKNDATYYQGIVGKANLNGDEFGWFLSKNTDNRFYFQVRHGTYTRLDYSTYSNIVYTDNSWHHLTGVVSASGAQYLYVDGVMQTAYSASGANPASAQPVVIGTSYGDAPTYVGYNERFKGPIDDVRVYNYARTQKQIMEDLLGSPKLISGGGNAGGAVGYWKFDEGYGQTTFDESGNNNDGTLAAATKTPTWTTAGKYGNALSFDGSNDYVSASRVAELTNHSYCAWAKADTLPAAYGIILENGLYTTPLGISSNGKWFANTGSNYDMTFSVDNVVLGRWYFLCGVYDATAVTLKLYVDGVYQSQLSGVSYWIYPYGSVVIGAAQGDYWAYYWHFDGTIDEAKIYPLALSADDIKQEYNRGSGVQIGSLSTASGGATWDNSANRSYCVPGDTAICNPPVSHWLMDERAGQWVYDVTGTNDGTRGATITAGADDPAWRGANDCKIGSCLSFDGTDDYVGLPNLGISGSNSFTMSAWIKPNGGCSQATVTSVAVFGAAGNFQSILLGYCGGTAAKTNNISFTGYGFAYGSASNTVTPNVWNQAVITYSGGNVSTGAKVYINGVQQTITNDQSTDGTLNLTNSNYAIGRFQYAAGGYFPGLIDDVRIYNYARTPAQVAWDYNRGAPIAQWNMDSVAASGTAGLRIYDKSAASSDGAFVGETMNNGNLGAGTAANRPSWIAGSACKYGSCLQFDGSDDYVSVADSELWNFGSNDFTINYWIKWNGTPSGIDSIIGQSSGGGTVTKWHIIWGINSAYAYTGTHMRLKFIDAGLTVRDVAFAWVPNGNQWYHLSFTRSGSDWKFYVDGVQTGGTQTLSATMPNVANILQIGSDGESWNFFPGMIDEVRIYNTALTVAQVMALYQGNDRTGGGTVSEDNLVGEWRLDDGRGQLYAADTHYQRVGKLGYAMKFDGTDDYVNANAISGLTSVHTLSAWIKPATVANGNYYIFDTGGAENNWLQLYDGDGDGKLEVRTGITTSGYLSYSNFEFTQANIWYHIVVTADDTMMIKVYINGVFDKSQTSNTVQNPGAIKIGSRGIEGYYFTGQIDDVRIYNYALTAKQIKTLYNGDAAAKVGQGEGLP